MNIQTKSPAEAATSPSHGSFNPEQGYTNMCVDSTSTTKLPPAQNGNILTKQDLDRLATALDLIATCEGSVHSLEYIGSDIADRIRGSTTATLAIAYNMVAELVIAAEKYQIVEAEQ